MSVHKGKFCCGGYLLGIIVLIFGTGLSKVIDFVSSQINIATKLYVNLVAD